MDGLRDGRPYLVAEEYWVVTHDIPQWDLAIDGAPFIRIIVDGMPRLRLDLAIDTDLVPGLPHSGSGHLMVAMTALRALPYVLASPPGVVAAPVFGAFRHSGKGSDMDRIGIEFLSVFGLPPVEFVTLAADLGCQYISTGLMSVPYNPPTYPPFSLRDDPALRREMVAAMRDRGVSISLGEGLLVRNGADVRDLATDLAIMAELGVGRINTVSFDAEFTRSVDQFGVLAEWPPQPAWRRRWNSVRG